MSKIKSIPEHGLGNQEMTFRMVANAIGYKVGICLSLVEHPLHKEYLLKTLEEIRALADSIVQNEDSGN